MVEMTAAGVERRSDGGDPPAERRVFALEEAPGMLRSIAGHLEGDDEAACADLMARLAEFVDGALGVRHAIERGHGWDAIGLALFDVVEASEHAFVEHLRSLLPEATS